MQCPSNQRYIESKCAILRILEPAPANFFQNKLVPAQISQSGNWVLAGRQLFHQIFASWPWPEALYKNAPKNWSAGGLGAQVAGLTEPCGAFPSWAAAPHIRFIAQDWGLVLKCGKTSMELESPPLTKFPEYNQPYLRQECLSQYLSNSTKI